MLAWFGGLWSSVARFASVGFGNVPYGLEIKLENMLAWCGVVMHG